MPDDMHIPFDDESSERRRARDAEHLASVKEWERESRPAPQRSATAQPLVDGIVGGWATALDPFAPGTGIRHGPGAQSLGPIPPHNNEAEQALLGALLVQNKAWARVADFLLPEHFADAVHGRIFAAIGTLIERGQVANPITLKNLFDQDGSLAEIGGSDYLVRLYGSVVTIINAEDYGRTILDLANRRQLLAMLDDARDDAASFALDRGAEEIAAELGARLGGITGVASGISKRSAAEAICEDLKKPRVVYCTGISTLDAALQGGLLPGRLYGIGARMKAGKTLLLGSISHNLNCDGVRHQFIPLEMGSKEIEQRNIAREGGFNSILFLTGERADFVLRKTGEYAATIPNNTIYEDAPNATFERLRQLVARGIAQGAKGVFVDYLQLVHGRGKGETEEQHTREVAQWLAGVARKFGVFIVLACQLNQDGNVRGGEGLKLACDAYFTLEHQEGRSDLPGRWMVMHHSRFSLNEHVGSESMPGLWRHDKAGPYFSADPPSGFGLPEQR